MTAHENPAVVFPLEDELILCCARTRLDEEATERVQGLLGQELDWIHLFETALRHRVLPLLGRQVLEVDPKGISEANREFLRASCERIGRSSLCLTSELLKIVDVFERHGIRAIPYKGPVLAAQAYGNVGLRDFSDLDFLVRQLDLPKAWELLTELGYRPGENESGSRAPSATRIPGQYLFQRPGDDILVELHTERTLRYFPKPPDLECLSENLQSVSLRSREIRTFPPEVMLSFLCVHGSKHFWERLQWICDIAALVEIPSGLDSEKALQEARPLGCERMVLLGLFLAHDLLGATLPAEVQRKAEGSPAICSLAGTVRQRLFRAGCSELGVAQRFLFRLRMAGGPWMGIRYCARLAFTPTTDDWETLRLPGPLGHLHPLLRPLRLARKYSLSPEIASQAEIVPYVPTPPAVVESMLALAELKPDDVVYDLGCGDGRVVIAAAERFGLRAVGVEIDPRRVREARKNACIQQVEHLVRFLCQDSIDVDLSEATVVLLYLNLFGNLRLERKLRESLCPGARVISRDFGMPGWPAEEIETYQDPGGVSGSIFRWRIGPAAQSAATAQRAAKAGG